LSGAPTRRLFFALWPDAGQRAALLHATAKIVRHCGGRGVAEANLHLTLAFLGSVPESRVRELSPIARRVAAGLPADAAPLAVSLTALDHWARAQVLVVLEREEEPCGAPSAHVSKLARLLTTETAAGGFSPDLKPFRAHVTVARKVARAPSALEMRPVLWSFDAFALVESRTLPEAPVYSVVESFVLGSAEIVRT
jgi:2'-5' RNA ligase